MVLVDNFGKLLAKVMRPPSNSISAKAVLIDTGGIARTFDVWSPGASFWRSGSTRVQIGDGTTPVDKADFFIDNPFGVAPENGLILSQLWGITLEVTQAQTLISNLGGAGTVEEVGLFKIGKDISATDRTIMLARDIVPPSPFLAGQNVITEHEFQI